MLAKRPNQSCLLPEPRKLDGSWRKRQGHSMLRVVHEVLGLPSATASRSVSFYLNFAFPIPLSARQHLSSSLFLSLLLTGLKGACRAPRCLARPFLSDLWKGVKCQKRLSGYKRFCLFETCVFSICLSLSIHTMQCNTI